jgi:cytoskeletal protein CcmA (bactofilin family)
MVSKFRHTLIVICFFVLLIALPAHATVINIDGLALWAGGTIGIGNNASIDAAIAAGGKITAGNSANLRSIYTEDRISLGNSATVNGIVLADKQAQAGNGLHLSGSWTGRSVSIGTNANITGDIGAAADNISLGNNASIMGDVLGNRNIQIGNNSTITGDVRPGSGYHISAGRNVSISGSTQPDSFSFDTFDLSQLDQLQQSAIGTENINGTKNSITTLMPDEYRDWSFGKNTTLNLSAGQYSLKNFWMDKSSVVNIDTSAGDVTLNVVGQFSTGNGVSFLKSGSGNVFINVFGHNVWLEDNVKLSAVFKVYGGNFGADKSAQLAGRYYATGNISVGNNSQVQYISTALPVPEPSTLVIFTVMGLLFGRRRQNKK